MLYTVTITNTQGRQEIWGNFETERKARKEAAWIAKRSFVAEVKIYRGGAGAERVS